MTEQPTSDSTRSNGCVVWLNGAFGAGKTTVAGRLVREWPRAALFDPEPLARLIRDAMPVEHRPADYQDSALWRRVTVETIAGVAAASQVVVVPMTLVDPDYFEEIVGGVRGARVDVHHFSLTARPATIRRRLLKRQVTRIMHPRSTRWGLDRVEACCAALADPTFREHIDTDALPPAEVVRRIVTTLATRLGAGV